MNVLLTNKNYGYTQVFIDGQELHRVVSIEYKESVTSSPTLVVELLPDEVELEVDDCKVNLVDVLEKKKKEDGYKEFVKFLFRGKYKVKEEESNEQN